MSTRLQTQEKAAPKPSLTPVQGGLLQRKCACGGAAGMSGECEERSKKKRFGLQTELKVSEPGDIYEQEADRIADQVMATPAGLAVSGASSRIQRFSEQSNGQMDSAPASVDEALASPGRPLEPALRQDMEQRFGHDFSRVRVHSDAAAEQSARDVNAHAYTVGNDIVFGAGRFASGTQQGQRLIAHELTHVAQDGAGIRRQQAPAPANFLTSDLAQQLSDEEIDRHIQGVIDREGAVAKGSPEAKTLADNLAVLEGEVKRRGSASPVLVRTALIRGAAEVVTRAAADVALNNGLFKATGVTFNAGAFDIFKDHFLGWAQKHWLWIHLAALDAGVIAKVAPVTDRPAAFAAIAQATPKFLAAWAGERLLDVWVSFLKMGDEIMRNVPMHSVEHLLVWLGDRRNEINAPMVELSSSDPAKVRATLEAIPPLFEKLDKEQKDLVALIKEGQEQLRKILMVTTIVQLVTSLASLRGLFTFPRIPPTPPTGMVPVAVGPGGVAIAGLALKPIEWAEVMRRFLQAGLITLPVASAAQKGGLILMATGGTPSGGGVPTPGTPSAATGASGSGGSTAPPRPRVSPGARPETAGSGGIASIDRTYDKATGVSQTAIEGRLQPTLPQRAGLEDLLGPTLPKADRAHLWGRIFGDEAAAGTLYAPSNFNRGVQLTIEKTLRMVQEEARAAGGYVWVRASNRSYPKTVLSGKALKEVKYEFQIRLNDGRISKTIRVEFNDIVVPGTAVTKNRPGFTISAPFEESVTP